jgi:hypothetical protein
MTANDVLSWYTGNPVKLQGYNDTLATTFEFIGPLSLPWLESKTAANTQHNFITPATVKIASASAADDAAGTGMRTLMLIGCDTSGRIQYETITLTGNTAVTSAKLYRLIYAMYGLTFGSSGCNEGIVYCANNASTFTAGVPSAPAAALVINIGSVGNVGQNMACNPCFMVPPGERYRLSSIQCGAAVQPIVVQPRIHPAAAGLVEVGGWLDAERISIGSSGITEYIMDILLEAGDMIRFDALSTTVAGQVSIKATLDKVRA